MIDSTSETLTIPHKIEFVELWEAANKWLCKTGDYNRIGMGRTTDFAKTLTKFCETHELRHLDIYVNQAGTYVAEVYGCPLKGGRT